MHRLRTVAAVLTTATALLAGVVWTGTLPDRGHAAGTPVASGKVSTFRPSGLPPVCTTQTLTPSQDTYVNQQAATTAYPASPTLHINARNGRRSRPLIQFSLPSMPTCTLLSATLRLNNTGATAGRTISVYRAAAAWTDSVVTFGTVPGETGTVVNASSASGWMQWTVTAHVQAMYAGPNNGFLVRDSAEGGNTDFTQVFESAESANKPELVLQWG